MNMFRVKNLIEKLLDFEEDNIVTLRVGDQLFYITDVEPMANINAVKLVVREE